MHTFPKVALRLLRPSVLRRRRHGRCQILPCKWTRQHSLLLDHHCIYCTLFVYVHGAVRIHISVHDYHRRSSHWGNLYDGKCVGRIGFSPGEMRERVVCMCMRVCVLGRCLSWCTYILIHIISGPFIFTLQLLNTFSNFGGTWPKFFVLEAVDFFTVATCDIPKADGSSSCQYVFLSFRFLLFVWTCRKLLELTLTWWYNPSFFFASPLVRLRGRQGAMSGAQRLVPNTAGWILLCKHGMRHYWSGHVVDICKAYRTVSWKYVHDFLIFFLVCLFGVLDHGERQTV